MTQQPTPVELTTAASPDAVAPVSIRRRRLAPWLLSTLVALLPLSLAIEQRIKVAVPALLFCAGVATLLGDREARACLRACWPLFAAALLSIVVAIANVLTHGQGWRPLDQFGHILLYAVAAAVFARHLHRTLMWVGFSLTAAALGGVCIWQHHVLGIARAYGLNGGASAAIELAVILLALALVALAQMLRTGTPRALRVLHGVCAAIAVYGALLTQSRGPLLAFIPAFLLIVTGYIQRSGRWRRGLLVICLSALAAVTVAGTMHGELSHRFDAIGAEVRAMRHGHDNNGSIGKRLEMWQVALRAFRQHPVQGIGLDRFKSYVQQEISAGRAWSSIRHYNQPHNAYLDAAASGGVISLAALLLVLVLPLRHFLHRMRSSDDEVAALASGAAAVVALYVLSGLGEGVFFRIMTLSLYFFLSLGFAVLIAALDRRHTAPAA